MDRRIRIEDKRGIKNCPELFCNIVFESTGREMREGKALPSYQLASLSEIEARELHELLGKFISTHIIENP